MMRTLQGTPVDELVAKRIDIPLADLTQEVIEAWQLKAFRRTLAHAKKHSRFYQKHLRYVNPDNIKSISDILQLPTTEENDLIKNESDFWCVSAKEISRIVTVPTTGTLGHKKRLSFDHEDIEKSRDFINRGFLTMQCRPHERMLILMSGTVPGSIGDLVTQAMAPLQMEIDVYGTVKSIKDAYDYLLSTKPHVIEAIPWQAMALAQYGKAYGNPEKEFIRSVNLSADLVPKTLGMRIQKAWDCSLHRHYGMTEFCIFGGVECVHQNGYHLRPCDIYYEIPSPDKDGFGEIMITTLDRYTMPLIRYRTGDIGRMIDTPCPCGCKLTRLETILGRKENRLTFQRGSIFFSEIADQLMSVEPIIDFELALKNLSSKQLLTVTAKTLSTDTVSHDAIKYALLSHPILKENYEKQALSFEIHTAFMDAFASDTSPKKRVQKNDV